MRNYVDCRFFHIYTFLCWDISLLFLVSSGIKKIPYMCPIYLYQISFNMPCLSRTDIQIYLSQISVICYFLYNSWSQLLMTICTWIWYHPIGIVKLHVPFPYPPKWLYISSHLLLIVPQLRVDMRILCWLHNGICNWLDLVQVSFSSASVSSCEQQLCPVQRTAFCRPLILLHLLQTFFFLNLVKFITNGLKINNNIFYPK